MGCRLFTDCESLVSHLRSQKASKGMSKRRIFDLADIREALQMKDLDSVEHIDGKTNPTDCLTKRRTRCLQTMGILQSVLRDGAWDCACPTDDYSS